MESIFPDDYCRSHENDSYFFCHKVNYKVPDTFCLLVCKGHWKAFWRPDIKEARTLHTKPIGPEDMGEDLWNAKVTVIMPVSNEEPGHSKKTIESLIKNALGPIEILAYYDDNEPIDDFSDGKPENVCQIGLTERWGQRKITNHAAKRPQTGEFIFRIDAHCNMSHGWDVRMKQTCEPHSIIVATFDALDTKTWHGKGKDMAFAILQRSLRKMFVRNWKPIEKRDITEETMTFSGTAWMMGTKDFLALGGHDESLAPFGAIGVELALKTWLTGGRVLLRTDVVCAHYFKTKPPKYCRSEEITRTFRKLNRQWVCGEDERIVRPMEWLVRRFEPLSTSTLSKKVTLTNIHKGFPKKKGGNRNHVVVPA